MPLKSVLIQGNIEGPIATLDIDLTYMNEDENNPIECAYELPLDKDTILSSLVAKIGDREVVAKVKAKEEAKENYEDAMAGGHAAVYAERKNKERELIKVKVGNLLPLQTAKISLQLIFKVTVDRSSYKFTLPADFYPNY